jgi:flagellar biosynthesis/type III secretory pathway M-ring protein FliF/YscJ
MEIGGFFLLVIVVVVVAVLGGIVYAIAARFRHKELSTDAEETGRDRRPTHHAVESEQNTDFVSAD